MDKEEPEIVYQLPRLWRFLLLSILFILFLGYDPAGVSSSGTRWIVRVMNYVGAPLYEGPHREKIVVVLADEESMKSVGKGWPLPYDYQAEVISTIMEHKPRMLAIDLLFLDQLRKDPEVELLWNTINEYRAEAPLFGATATLPGSSLELIRNAQGDELPFDKADVLVKTDWPDMGYRLNANARPQSMAFEMYRALCDPDWPGPKRRESPDPGTLCPTKLTPKEDESKPSFDRQAFEREMLVFWGTGKPDYRNLFDEKMDIAENIFTCQTDPDSVWERLVGLILTQNYSPDANCAFHAVLPLDLLMRLDWDVAKEALHDKIVFYGVDHVGIPDIVSPPTIQSIPGIHLHAMALDNLLTYGPDYFGTESKRLWGIGSLNLATLQMLVALFVILIIFLFLMMNPIATGRASPRPIERRYITDFKQLKQALRHYRNMVSLGNLFDDTKAGIVDWHNYRAASLSDAKNQADRVLRKILWGLAFPPTFLFRTFVGRLLLFAALLVLLFYLDVAVLRVPPIDAFHLIAVLLAAKLVVPAQIFHPRRSGSKR